MCPNHIIVLRRGASNEKKMSCSFDLFPHDDWSLLKNPIDNPADEGLLFNNDENDRDDDVDDAGDGIDDDVLEVLKLLLEEDPPDTGQQLNTNSPFQSFIGGEYCQLVTPPNGSCNPEKETASPTNNNHETTTRFFAPWETPLDQGKRLSRAWTLDQDDDEEGEAPSKKRKTKEPHDSAFVQPRGKDPTVSLGGGGGGDSPETNTTPSLYLDPLPDDQQDDSGGPTTTTRVANAASARPKRSPAVKPSRHLFVVKTGTTNVVKTKKKRRPQLCRKCGELRKFHVCKGIGRAKVRERKVCGTQTPPHGILLDTEPGTRLLMPSRTRMEKEDDDCSTNKQSGGYLCGRCGQKKKGHTCPFEPSTFWVQTPVDDKDFGPQTGDKVLIARVPYEHHNHHHRDSLHEKHQEEEEQQQFDRLYHRH